jgi:lipid A disaccharide synthetase
MAAARPGLRFVLPVAPGLSPWVEPMAQPLVQAGLLKLVQGQSHDALAAADVALVASGTATLEAALLKCPQVIVYRLAQADWQRMRRMRLQPWVGLPNILSREFIVPERIQDEAQPDLVAADALRWLDDAGAVQRYRSRCLSLHLQPEYRREGRCRAGGALGWLGAIERLLRMLPCSRPSSCPWVGHVKAWSPAWTRPAAARWPVPWWLQR